MSDLFKFLSKILLACLLIILVAWASYIGVRYYHAEQVAYRWVTGLRAKEAEWSKKIDAAGGNTLAGYIATSGPKKIDGLVGQLSGLTYDALQQRLFAVISKPATLVALSPDGRLLAQYPFKGINEVKGVAWLGGNKIALVDPRRNRIVVTEIPPSPQAIDVTRAFSLVLRFAEDDASNVGFEGLGYDLRRDRLYVAKEHSPRTLFRISGLNYLQTPDSRGLRIENISAWLEDIPFATDLASVEADPETGMIFILSEESQMLLQLDGDNGTGRGMLSLAPMGQGGTLPRPEGVALDDKGNIFIVSEPNLLFRLTKR
jgi:uncharacterized protein YjiK